MSSQDILIRNILDASGIVGRRARREVELELQSHLEEIFEESRADGLDDREIERIIRIRFGNPEEIAGGFARVYRPERTVVRIAEFSLLTAVSVAIIMAFAYVVELVLALGMGVPSSSVLSSGHLRTEPGFIAGLAVGYLELYFSVRMFAAHRQVKSMLLCGSFSAAACLVIQYVFPPLGMVLALGFICALVLRTVELLSSRSLVRLTGAAAVLSLGGFFAPPCLKPAANPGALLAIAAVCVSISISGHLMATLARAFDRRILRRDAI